MALSRKTKIIVGVVAVILLGAIIIGSIFATRKDTPEVTIVKVETRKELRSTVTSSGEVRPIQFMNLTSEVQGRIEEIYVKEGDQVTKGQPLVRLDPNQLQSNTDAQLASAQASQTETQVSRSQAISAENQLSQVQQGLNASQAQVDTARQQVLNARQQVDTAQTEVDRARKDLETVSREFKRTAELFEAGVSKRFDYDADKDKVDQAQISLRAALARLQTQKNAIIVAEKQVNEQLARAKQQEDAVKVARRGVDTANFSANVSLKRAEQQAAILRGQRNQRDKTMQVAPINGVIAEIPSKVGTFAVAGLSTTALLTIADMSQVNVEVKVDETSIDKVEVGQKAKIKVDAFGDKEIVGEVIQKTPLAVGKSQTSGGLSTNINVQEAKEFRVVIQMRDLPKEIQDGLRPGMSATAEITTKIENNVIAIPLQAVIEKKPDAQATPTIKGDAPQPAVPGEKPKMITGVYVLDGNKAKFVEVTTGIIGESDRQILTGLKEGDRVITGPSRVLNTLKEGAVVKEQTKKEGDAAAKV